MAKNYDSEGNILRFIAPAGGVVGGLPYLIGVMVVMASHSASAGEEFEGETGKVWNVDKVSADVTVQGNIAYLVSGGTAFTTVSSGGNTRAGIWMEAYGNGVTAARVRLDSSPS